MAQAFLWDFIFVKELQVLVKGLTEPLSVREGK